MVYNVHIMKYLKVAEARAQFGDILDLAEAGDPVVIERRGVRFRVVVDAAPATAAPAAAGFAFVDDAVLGGEWSWQPARHGVRFKARRKAR